MELSIAPPIAMGMGTGALKTELRLTGSKKMGGLEAKCYTFRVFFNKAQFSSQTAGLFAGAGYEVVSKVPISPYFIGGILYKLAQAYRLYKFDQISLQYIPTVPTTEAGGVALAYDPKPYNDSQDQITEANNLGQLFQGVLNLAQVAAGPAWQPLVAAGGNLMLAAGEKLISWLQNRKPTNAGIDMVSSSLEEFEKSLDLDAYLQALNTWLESLPGSEYTGPLPTTPQPIFGTDMDVPVTKLMAGIRAAAAQLNSEILATTQGHAVGTNSTYKSGTGVADPRGYIMISGTVWFADPISSDADTSVDFGDPLDISSPTTAPFHQGLTAAERVGYLHQTYEMLVSAKTQAVLMAHGYPPLVGPLGSITETEKHWARLQAMKKSLAHSQRFAPRIDTTRAICAAAIKPSREDKATHSDEPDWHEVTKEFKSYSGPPLKRSITVVSGIDDLSKETDIQITRGAPEFLRKIARTFVAV